MTRPKQTIAKVPSEACASGTLKKKATNSLVNNAPNKAYRDITNSSPQFLHWIG